MHGVGRLGAAGQDRRAAELVGDLDGPVAAVDAVGTVEPLGSRWRLSWAVGAEDRWHIAAEEAAVRSRLIDDMPVVETAMRVPGGDVVQRAAAVRDGAGRAVVLEFANETPAPVSLALAVSGSIKRAAVRGSRLIVGDRTAADFGRAVGGAAAVGDGDVWDAVRGGPSAGDRQSSSRSGLAAAAAVLPLARGVPLRILVPVEGDPPPRGSPEEAAAGWRAVVSRAASVELPDETAERAWQRGIAACVQAAGGAGVVAASRAAVVLDRVGLADEADRGREMILQALTSSRLLPTDASAALLALASRRLRAGRESGLVEWAGPLVELAGDSLDPFTLEQVAAALEQEAPAAARDARRLLAGTTSAPASAVRSAGDITSAIALSASFGGDGLAGTEALLDCMIAESADHLVLVPVLVSEWVGASLDARDLVTRHGVLSFAVRWHGSLPAVLWDLQPPGAEDPVATMRCGLDDYWTTESRAGEALLGTERR